MDVVQLILGAFISSIMVKLRNHQMLSGVKVDYIEKDMILDTGFHKTLEKVMCLRSHTLVPILQMHTHKFKYKIHSHKGKLYAEIHCSKLNAHQCEIRTKCFSHCSHLTYLLSEIMLIMVNSIRQ